MGHSVCFTWVKKYRGNLLIKCKYLGFSGIPDEDFGVLSYLSLSVFIMNWICNQVQGLILIQLSLDNVHC